MEKDNVRAQNLFQKALALDPEYAGAWTWLGWTHFMDARRKWTTSPEGSFKLGMEAVEKIFEFGPNSAGGHALLGALYLLQGKHEQGIAEQEKAIRLAPNNADRLSVLAINKILRRKV